MPVLLALTVLTGCFDKPQAKVQVQEPPYVPAIQPEVVDLEANHMPAIDVRAYADLRELADNPRYHPQLAQAVSDAIRAGVLQPAGLNDRFEPEHTVAYDDFRDWATRYQTALSETGLGVIVAQPVTANSKGAKTLNGSKSPSVTKPPRELVPHGGEDLDSPMNANRMMMLPEIPVWDTLSLPADRPLSREAVCALAVMLSGQEVQASALDDEAIENMAPGNDPQGSDEVLSQFTDYAAISPWARRYVAVAYKTGLLQKLFRLTPDRLTIDAGFKPTAPVRREEAIVLLDMLYGRYQVSYQPSKPAKSAEDNVSGNAKPSADFPVSELVAPVSTLKTVRETGPGYHRETQEINTARL